MSRVSCRFFFFCRSFLILFHVVLFHLFLSFEILRHFLIRWLKSIIFFFNSDNFTIFFVNFYPHFPLKFPCYFLTPRLSPPFLTVFLRPFLNPQIFSTIFKFKNHPAIFILQFSIFLKSFRKIFKIPKFLALCHQNPGFKKKKSIY